MLDFNRIAISLAIINSHVFQTKGLSMASLNVDKLSLKELLDLEAKIERAIPVARERQHVEVKQELATFAQKRGFSLRDLFGGRGKGKLSVPKYANPDDRSQTWTGRGRKPNWLLAKVKRGATLEQLAI
jgi:DNA-binding protein H-NS